MKQVFSNRGNTIVEIMIALGLVGLVTMGIITLSQDTLKTIQNNKLAATRDQLATQFRQTASRIPNLILSIKKPENKKLLECVCGIGPDGCKSAVAYDFSLYEPSNKLKPIDTFYDSAGLPCDENAENCTIKITQKFIAQCAPVLPSADPTAPASCVGVPVEFFAVTYVVQQNKKTNAHGILFKSISGSVFTQVSNLVTPGSGVCP